jgi:hypothetical protein
MKKINIAIALFLFCTVCSYGQEVFRKSGKIKLKEAKNTFDKKAFFNVKIGKKIAVEGKFGISDFFNSKVVMANANVKNTSKKDLYYAYFVAFFDKNKNLIGCASQGNMTPLKAGKATQLGSCIIQLPESEIKKITSYQLVFIESDKKIGQ